MKILNMVDPNKSQIKFKVNSYPDEQQNIVITGFKIGELEDGEHIKCCTQNHLIKQESIQIKSRLNNWLDLELITCAVASLRELGVEEIHLYVPYILGSRSDRKFEEGGNNYLKDVICPIINSLNFKTVTCIDSHSDVLEACIKGFKKRDNLELIRKFFLDTYNKPPYNEQDEYPCILISPDAGASKKIYKLAEQIGYKGDIITCSKDRDENGKLTKANVPKLKNNKKDYILIDDIGDRFGTFKNIAKEIKKDNNFSGKLYLIVTHSIQDEGIYEALKYFEQIYTTNSFKDRNIENCKILNIF